MLVKVKKHSIFSFKYSTTHNCHTFFKIIIKFKDSFSFMLEITGLDYFVSGYSLVYDQISISLHFEARHIL